MTSIADLNVNPESPLHADEKPHVQAQTPPLVPQPQATTANNPSLSSPSLASDPNNLKDTSERREVKLSIYDSDLPLPPLPEDIHISPRRDSRSSQTHPDPRSIPLNARRISLASAGGYIEPPRKKTAGERLDPTLIRAVAEKERYAFKAKLTGFALNAAIGMQVVLGALTTGLSVVTTGHQTQIMTAVLGGIATIVASYLARARGSNEPELSIARVKDLEQFIRECEAFKMDKGHLVDDSDADKKVLEFRRSFEDLLGNASGERKLSA